MASGSRIRQRDRHQLKCSLQSSLLYYFNLCTCLLHLRTCFSKSTNTQVIPNHATTASYSIPCSTSDRPKLTCGDMIFQVFLKQKTSGASAPPVLAFFSLSTKQTVRQECRGQRPLTLKTACNKEQEYACISLSPLSGGIGLILQLLLDKTF